MPIYKYEASGVIFKNLIGNKSEKYTEGYRLIVVDLNKDRVDVYADKMQLDIISSDMKTTGNKFVVKLICKDDKNLDCKVAIYHTDNKPEMIGIYYNTFELTYFISKQRQ